jgi:hypothetical protein
VTGHVCSTKRFKIHTPRESERQIHVHDIQATSPGTTRNYQHSHKFGVDGKDTEHPYNASIQHSLGAQPGLHHRPSTTGLLGDASLGGNLAHRSPSWRLMNKGNASSLSTDDIEGAQPGEPNRFLQVTKRHLNPMVPQYTLPKTPPRTEVTVKASGRDFMQIHDINNSDKRNLFGTGWTAERRERLMGLQKDRKTGLEGKGMALNDAGIPDFTDVPGTGPDTTHRMRMARQFGCDDRNPVNPLGHELLSLTRGNHCPGVSGSTFKSQRHCDPLQPSYRCVCVCVCVCVDVGQESRPRPANTWKCRGY